MKKKHLIFFLITIIILSIIFFVIGLIFNKSCGILCNLGWAIILIIPFIFAIIKGLKVIEIEEPKKVLWKMPFRAFIVGIIVTILYEFYALFSVFVLSPEGGLGDITIIYLPIIGVIISIIFAIVSFVLSLIIYYVYKN
ncbi:hypothetical protein J4429_02030 [Candidatus Pacearchaeota archaeon]|nr:hypothetical protein [Candidatus Pacearchaeota archaeon]